MKAFLSFQTPPRTTETVQLHRLEGHAYMIELSYHGLEALVTHWLRLPIYLFIHTATIGYHHPVDLQEKASRFRAKADKACPRLVSQLA